MVKVRGTCQFIDEGGVVNALHGGGGIAGCVKCVDTRSCSRKNQGCVHLLASEV